ncbi:MAG: DUF4397 domain-containing protein [Gaiellaceae bacterium]
MRLKLVLLSAMAAALAIWLVPAASATYGKGHDRQGHDRNSAVVNVVHGIPGAMVDVCASGAITDGAFAPVITHFEFTQIEKLYLPAGEYDIKVVGSAEKNSCAADAIPGLELNDAAVPAGANISIVANLSADGKAFALTVGVNDTSKLDKGAARVTAYHTAAAPDVDIWAAGRDMNSKAIAAYGDFAPALTALTNGSSKAGDVPANRYKLAIAAAPSESADGAVKTLRAKLKRNKNTIFYAVGSLADNTFTVLKQRIKVDRHHHAKWTKHRHGKWSKHHGSSKSDQAKDRHSKSHR